MPTDQPVRNTASTGDRGLWPVLGIALLALAAYLPMVMRQGVAEPDSAKTCWALARGIQTGRGFDIEIPLYGLYKNQGYYQMFFWLYPRSLDVGHVHLVMNYTSALAMAFVVTMQFVNLRRLIPPALAAMACAVAIFSPVYWNLSGYGHPTPVAFALFTIGWYCQIRGLETDSRRRIGWYTAMVAWLTFACWIRSEILMAFPVLAATAFLNTTGDIRSKLVGVVKITALGTLAGALFYLIMSYTAVTPRHKTDVSFTEFVVTFIQSNKTFKYFLQGFGYWAVSSGPLTALLAVAGLVAVLRRRDWGVLLILLAFAVPASLWCMPDPGRVARYFTIQMVGVAGLASYLFLRRNPKVRVAGTIGLILGSYLSSELVYPLLSRYDWYYERDRHRPVSLSFPLGGMIGHRLRTEALVAELNREARRIMSLKDTPIFVIGFPVTVRLGYLLTATWPQAEWSIIDAGGERAVRVLTPHNEIVFLYDRTAIELKKWLPKVAAQGTFSGYGFYECPQDVVSGDRMKLPEGLRLLELDKLPPSAFVGGEAAEHSKAADHQPSGDARAGESRK